MLINKKNHPALKTGRQSKWLAIQTFLLLLFFTLQLSGQVRDCSQFKNGTFFLLGQDSTSYVIKRQGNTQSETAGNSTMEFKIKWISNCSYTLEPTKKTIKDFPGLKNAGTISTEIIEVKENSYVFRTVSDMFNNVVTGEMIRIE